MRKNWKRVLAAVLAACMIFCDSSLVYAAESQPIVETSETETEVEATEIGDETILPEATEEEVITEESAEEAEQEEFLLEEETMEEEKEVVEIEPVTEVKSVEQMNTTAYESLVAGTAITVEGGTSGISYNKTFEFTPTSTNHYYLYVDGTAKLNPQINAYNAEGIFQYTVLASSYAFDADAKLVSDVVNGYLLSEGTTYRISIQGSIAANETISFCMGTYAGKPTELVAGAAEGEYIPANSRAMFKISESETTTGVLSIVGCNTDNIRINTSVNTMQKHINFSDSGKLAMIALEDTEYYIAVQTGEDSGATLFWNHMQSETLSIGDTKEIEGTDTYEFKFYEFVPNAEKDYLISAYAENAYAYTSSYEQSHTGVLYKDGSLRTYNPTLTGIYGSEAVYGEDYTEQETDIYWKRYQFPENCSKLFVIVQVTPNVTTEVKLREIVVPSKPEILEEDTETTIAGGIDAVTYDKWHQITPTADTYYYLNSIDLSVAEIGIWNEEYESYDTVETDYTYILKSGAATVDDVVKSYKLNAKTTYGIRIRGTVPTTGTTYAWTKPYENQYPERLDFSTNHTVNFNSTGVSIYEISEETTTLGMLSFTDWNSGSMKFYGDSYGGVLRNGDQKIEQTMVAIGGNKTYVVVKRLGNTSLSWTKLTPTILTDGYSEEITANAATTGCYEFTPDSLGEYYVLADTDSKAFTVVGTDGNTKLYGSDFTDEQGTWKKYSQLTDVEKIYLFTDVYAGNTGRVVFKKITSAIDETEINDTLTVNQVVSVSGGENGVNHTKGYTFIPKTSGYYYLESDVLRDYSYAVYDGSTGYYDYSPNLSVCCVRKDNATTVKDIVTSHYFEEGKSYLVYITGTVSANSFATFTWKECTAPDDSTEVYLDGEPITVPGGEISIYKLRAEETTVANVLVNGWDFLEVYGDNYKGLPYGYTVGDTKQHENVMAVGKGKTYYYVLAPTEDATITFKEEVTKTIKPDEEFTVEAPSDAKYDIVCHEFIPETGVKYEAHYGIGDGNKAIAIMEKDGNLSWVTEGTITGSDGKLWTEINATDNIEKVYLFTLAEAGTPQMVALKSATPADNNNMTLNTFDESITVPAGKTVTVTYAGPHLGDYFINAANAGVKFEHISAAPELELKEYNNMGTQYAYVLSDDYHSNTTETTTFTFKLINEDTEHNKTVWISSSASYIIDESYKDSKGNLVVDGCIQSEKAETYATYYRFAINKTGDYYHPEMVWILKEQQDVDGNKTYTRWDTDVHKVDDNTYTLNAGETYIVKFLSYRTSDDQWTLAPFEISKNWIDFMEVQAEKTLLAVGESLQLEVTTIGEDSNFPAEGKVAYTTSNKAIATVDENGEIKALKEGTATITVIANAGRPDKQFEKTLTITVSPKYQIIYYGIGGEDGNPGGYLSPETPFEFYKNEGTTLVDPVVNEGYEFLGWYSDAKKTKKVTSIAKGTKTNVNLWPKFELKNYIINYEFGYDEKFAADVNQPLTFTIVDETVLTAPIRLGYVLNGWDCYVNEELVTDLIKSRIDDEDSEKITYYIPSGTKTDIKLCPKWKFDTTFGIAVNTERKEGKLVITHPYNTATGKWDYLDSSFTIRSFTTGIVPELYALDGENPSVRVQLKGPGDKNYEWTSNRPSDYPEDEEYNVTVIPAEYISTPGEYFLQVIYKHPGQEEQSMDVMFTVVNAKREYPVNKEITLEKLSNIEKEKLELGTKDVTFSMITSELVNKMQPMDAENDQPIKVDGYLLENLVSDIIIKNSKNKVVNHETKLSNGIYTITLVLEENEKFLEEVTSTVKIGYGTMKAAGVQYTDEEGNPNDSYGRVAGTKIATSPNETVYLDHSVITPMIQLPWKEHAIPVSALKAALEEAEYPGYNITITAEKYNEDVLSVETVENEETETIAGVKVTGKVPGKSNILLTTYVTSEDDSFAMEFPVTIKNFTVVSGDKEAIETITFERFCEVLVTGDAEEEVDYQEYSPEDTDENTEEIVTKAKMYLVESPMDGARNFRIYWSANDFAGGTVTSALNWKSSSTKLASLKVKEDYVDVTVPKNAQGVVEITASAKDEGKRSQSMKLVIVDTKMRLETTNLTMNSKVEDESAIAYLYPNVLASKIDEVSIESLFGNTITVDGNNYKRIDIYKKVGKSGYEKSEVFNSSYESANGELKITFDSGNYPVKAATHTVYVGILHEKDIMENPESPIPSERYALKIKDTCELPKAPTLKVTKSYETAYINGWAELTMTLKNPVAKIGDTNIPNIEVEKVDGKDKYEVYDWKDVNGDGTVWNFKLRVKNEVPTKTLKNVKFLVKYAGYRAEEYHTVETNISVTNNPPKLYVYGEDSYAPVYYTDVDSRFVDVVIPVNEELVPGFANDYKVESNDNSTGVRITATKDPTKYLDITVKDTSRIQIDHDSVEYHKDYGTIPAKKGEMNVEHAIKLSVWIQKPDNPKTKEGNVNLSFYVESSELGNTVATQKLTVKPRVVKSDSILLLNSMTEQTVKSVTFNNDSNYRGKEFIEIKVQKPTGIGSISEHNTVKTKILVEAADNNTKKMLQNNELLVENDEGDETLKITPANKAFNYKSAKLKVTMKVSNEELSAQTKSVTLSLSFKKVPAPKITISAAKMVRNMQYVVKMMDEIEVKEIERTQISTNVKFANMPVGSKVIDIRFADRADYAKYYAPNNYEWGNKLPEKLYLEAREDVELPLGKDIVDLVYDVQTATGHVIRISTSVTLTIVDNLNFKTNVKNMNLYNSAADIKYGKSAMFYDAKGNAVEIKEIVNAEELKNAGISFDILSADETGYEGKGVVKFYVDKGLNRGIEKTYTAKVKVAAVNSAAKNANGNWTTTTATEKTLTFKIVLKK